MNMRGALARRSYGAAALIWLCLIAPSFAKCAPSPNNGAQSDDGGVEYRLLTPNGRPAKWADGKPEELGILPFMTCNDFTRAIAYPSKNPNTPGQYEVELQHNAIGKAKLRAVADADRTRGYCLVVNDIVLTCVNFAPYVKGVWVDSTLIYGFGTKTAAQAAAQSINRAMRGR